ncbi:hypothetical protein DFQ27_002661 [Actinomortierella ambigua]|uniref:Uncharacterized protein n=1 Tax=Actinomortierella ambigua TaxID=1343610 RepID=A0A9P6UCR4_9FUNG|nr:hypothetical protein DFQ27_002661 [Actinomortierella ambigua]
MADYLSFVQIVRWERALRRCFDEARDVYSGNTHLAFMPTPSIGRLDLFMVNVLTMATCGHQLGKMKELKIDFTFIEDFIGRASELSRLERIFIFGEQIRTAMDMYPAVIRLVKAIQLGGNSLYDCRIAGFWSSGTISPLVIELNSLLPVPRALQGLVESPRPLDRYLTQLEELHIESIYTPPWLQIARYYTDLPPSRILQCSRELTYLKIECDLLIHDTNLLAWAAQEARDRAAGKRMPPAVPLKTLVLEKNMNQSYALKTLRDAILGSQRRSVGSPLDHGDSFDDEGSSLLGLENSELSEMPSLTRLDWTAPDLELFDPHLLLICSKLKTLMLEVDDAIPAGSPVQLWSLPSHVRLVHLCLKGACVNAFDPTGLANMVNLKELVLEQVPENPTTERSLRMERWTWDWHLPQLWKLEVRCAIEGWFSLRILRTCPELFQLSIDSTCKQLLEVASVLDDPSGDYFVGVSKLEIFGAWDITPTDFVYLLHRVLPCVRDISLHKFDSCTALQVVEATRDHPVLEEAHFPMNFLSSKEREDIGLCEVIDVNTRRNKCLCVFGYPIRCVWNDE